MRVKAQNQAMFAASRLSFVFYASIACIVFKIRFSGRHPKLDQVVNAVGLTIWSMLVGLATWSMLGGGVGGIVASTETPSVVDCG